MNDAIVDALIAYCWPDGDRLSGDQVYMLLDGARDPAIAPLVRFGRLEWDCLYAGPLTRNLQAAAPYIVHLAADSPQTRTLLARGWGNSWGMLTIGPPQLTLEQQRLHFKKLLRVREEAGTLLNFRFYDPRVLRIFLPTCLPQELATVFGPVPRLIVEAAGPQTLLAYRFDGAQLRTDTVELGVPAPPN